MPNFQLSSTLKQDANTVRKNIFTMKGVNAELYPFIKMTAPNDYITKSILEWPKNEFLFNSVLLLGGVIPIDLHRFKFVALGQHGFEEDSCTLMNKRWNHKREIVTSRDGCVVTDRVSYEPRIALVGKLLKPVYQFIFKHRHKKLLTR